MATDVLERIKGKLAPEELAEVSDIVKKSIVSLGTDEAFALRDSAGEIRAFKQRVRLTAADGTLIQPVPGGPYVVSAQGYEVVAEAAGVCVMLPEQVLVDGEMKRNPYVMRDPQNGRILAIYARAVALRHSSKGLPQVSDWVTLFDTPSYRMIDLLAKARKSPTAFRFLPAGEAPAKEAGKTWARYEFDGSTALWVDTSHEEALSWYTTIINREKKAIDYAQTFAKRNAVKHLLGIQKAPGPVWDLTVLCWRPMNGSFIKWDFTKYVETRRRAERIIRGEDEFIKKNELEYVGGKECVGEDEAAAAAVDSEINQDDEQAKEIDEFVEIPAEDVREVTREPKTGERALPPKPEPPKAKKAKPQPAPASGVFKDLAIGRENFPEEYRQALEELGVTEDGALSRETAQAVVDRLNRILDL